MDDHMEPAPRHHGKRTSEGSAGSSDSFEYVAMEGSKKVKMTAEQKHLLNTTFCEICGGLQPFEGNEIILCDGVKCNKAYHAQCLSPPLEKVPEGDFLGPCCQASIRPAGKSSGRGHMRLMRLLNRSQHKDARPSGTGPSDALPIKGLFSQFGQAYSTRRKSNIVERIDDDEEFPVLRKSRSYSSGPESMDTAPYDCNRSKSKSPKKSTSVDTSSSQWQSCPESIDDNPNWHVALMKSHSKLIDDLSVIVGMERVKELLIDINGKIVLRKERIRRSSSSFGGRAGSPTSHVFGSGMAPHMVIVGNPGTGKSMIGRILAKMLHRANAVKQNIFVKAHRSDLVAGYLGQTALKTAQLIDQARGGVMFIDEAHQLINPNKEDYGIEAYREIMKEMLNDNGNDQDRVTFIFAGYSKQMNLFLKHDAGMESRISFKITLPDYSPSDLSKICDFKLRQRDPADGLPCELDGSVNLEEILALLPSDLIMKYNARIVDLLLDQAEAHLARRVLLMPEPSSTGVDIMKLTDPDLRSAAISLRREMIHAATTVNSPNSSSDSE